MLGFVGQWSHALAAILFGAFALWNSAKALGNFQLRALVTAALLTSLWGLSVAMNGEFSLVSLIAEHCRNLGWLAYMYILWRQGGAEGQARTVAALYLVVGAVILLCTLADAISAGFDGSRDVGDASFFVMTILRIMVSVAALMLVHNLYTAATPEARTALRIPMVALAAMWTYDLNLYTISYLTRSWSVELLQLRGVALSAIAPILALATHRGGTIKVRLSRTITFQSLGLVSIGAYLMAMVLVTSALQMFGGDYARLGQVGFVFLASIAALVLVPSRKFRAWLRVKVAKHLFAHRYDYRAEWMRFTATLGRPDDDASPLDIRAIQAIADITESRGGMLLVPDGSGGLIPQTLWNWDGIELPAQARLTGVDPLFGDSGRVLELDTVRAEDGEDARLLPSWLLDAPDSWAIVPLIHFDTLSGAVVLATPPINRALDWEDFDLLRIAGRQVASYLAEARGEEALSDARRFDEFNRRFAFIMHDIKNLVSQLSLVARNAERHADNPEFRADMIATLQSSVARMNDLLARLSQHNKGKAETLRPIALGPIIAELAKARRAQHPVIISGDLDLFAEADSLRLEQALGHLLQNAIDASPPAEPVSILVRAEGEELAVDVMDRGKGMSAAFIRDKLFKPFASTKDNGFGVGAFEARTLVIAMGGRLQVTSREGEGSQFTIFLKLARQHRHQPEARAA
jgi:putative PEP-CTERM system histidine kinase